jgi:hypothetical protein
MKLEYLATGSPDCPLIRLYDFKPLEASALHAAIASLATEAADQVEIHQLPFVKVVEGCRLTLVRSTRDQAVISKGRLPDFECRFTAGTWDNVADLMAPFAVSARGFQWLTGVPGEISVLLSASGEW